jgi:hypothetical protein
MLLPKRSPINTGGISHMKDMMIDIEAERFDEWLEEITRMLSLSLKNGRRPRTCITGKGGAC